jgi:putative oxidoreductase
MSTSANTLSGDPASVRGRAFEFHTNFADQIQAIMFLKNVSIAGAFLLLVANGAGPLSIDRRLAR